MQNDGGAKGSLADTQLCLSKEKRQLLIALGILSDSKVAEPDAKRFKPAYAKSATDLLAELDAERRRHKEAERTFEEQLKAADERFMQERARADEAVQRAKHLELDLWQLRCQREACTCLSESK